MSFKRKCIFTGKESNHKAVLDTEDTHNWARAVPCDKDYYFQELKDKELNDTQLELVFLFYKKELALIEINNIEKKMQNLIKKLKKEENTKIIHTKNKLQEDKKIKTLSLKNEKEELTKKESNIKINKEKLWD